MSNGRYHTSSDVFDQARTWKFRITLASFTHDPMGALVRAVLGINMKKGMAYGLQGEIDEAGIVRAPVRAIDGSSHDRMPIGTVQSVRDEFRRLSDHCKLTDEERTALFDELRKWMGKDARAQSGLDVRHHN